MTLSYLYPPVAGAVVASLAATGGVLLTERSTLTRYLIRLSGALLIGVAALVLMPELAGGIGWPVTVALAVAGYIALMAVDRVVFSVCPSCDHKEHALEVRLRGFAAPLLSAVAIHSFVDGWGLVAAHMATPGAGTPLTLAILLHKVPEGLTLGAMTRASFDNANPALAWCVAVEMATIAGGGAGLWLTPAAWISYPLAIAAGTFLFLGGGALGVRLGRKAQNFD